MEKLDNYTITSPMDGVVLRRDGEVGEIAEPGRSYNQAQKKKRNRFNWAGSRTPR
jgi:multidrug resistance efflux pump